MSSGGKLQGDRFTASSSFINAVYSNPSPGGNVKASGGGGGTPSGQTSPALPNYSKYLKR